MYKNKHQNIQTHFKLIYCNLKIIQKFNFLKRKIFYDFTEKKAFIQLGI